MSKLKKAIIPSLSTMQIVVCATALLGGTVVNADSVTLTETQTQKLQCKTLKDEATNKKYKDCSKISTGTYTGTIKIGAETLLTLPGILYEFGIAEDVENLAALGVDISNLNFTKLTKDQMAALLNLANKIHIADETVLAVNIGDYTFSLPFGDAKLKPSNAKDGTWTSYYKKLGYDGDCPSAKCGKAGTVNMNYGLTGITIKFSGSSNDVLGYGQAIFASACEEANSNSPTLTAPVKIKNGSAGQVDGSISLGDTAIPFAVNVQCNGVKALKETNGLTKEQAILNNFTKITGKIAL